MSVLEIVLVSVLGSIVLVWIIALFVIHELQVNKAENYNIMNENAEKGKIVLFGDSLTDFYDVQEFIAEPTIYNRGIANDTTTNLLHRMENVISIQPSKLFLLIGTNDIGRYRKIDKIAENIDRICNIIVDAVPNVKMYIISEYPTNKKVKFFSPFSCNNRTAKHLIKLNEYLVKMCEEKSYTYIDIFPLLADKNQRLKKEYTIEGLHLNSRGYQVVTKKLLPYINE